MGRTRALSTYENGQTEADHAGVCQTMNISLVGPAPRLRGGAWAPMGSSGPQSWAFAPPGRAGEACCKPGGRERRPGAPALPGHEHGREGNGAARVTARSSTGHATPRTPEASHPQPALHPSGSEPRASARPRPRTPPTPRGSPASTGKRQPRSRRTRGYECACVSGPAQHRPRLATARRAPSVGRARDLGSVYKRTPHAIPTGCPFPDRPHPVGKKRCSTSTLLTLNIHASFWLLLPRI